MCARTSALATSSALQVQLSDDDPRADREPAERRYEVPRTLPSSLVPRVRLYPAQVFNPLAFVEAIEIFRLVREADPLTTTRSVGFLAYLANIARISRMSSVSARRLLQSDLLTTTRPGDSSASVEPRVYCVKNLNVVNLCAGLIFFLTELPLEIPVEYHPALHTDELVRLPGGFRPTTRSHRENN